ncbi:hypothetical protein C8A00DRAFT_40624 [Chaetomidium leptoderma]|uniref:Uncharacterized protein n=1 Tax=Chaetomidium leptoderma TaxID=669021 RepID=A0AAN6VT99_9PEZI|nr:hypothetical protein C8A00DRAFT_40624 [Chaetomidium leptoderma]
MTPPASQCRRALQRRIVPPRDSVWITDGLLASAFERYCRVSRTWNRKASNVPGPLESQRRLGRRRMGDASTWHCPPTPPSWAFLVPLNLSQWTWKPPSLARAAEHSRSRHDDTAPGELVSLLPRWLRESVPQEADEPPITLASMALPDTSPSHTTTTRAPPHADLMDDFRWAATHADDAALASYTNEMCGRLRQRIILGQLSPDDIFMLSREIWETLGSRLRRSSLGHRLSMSSCRAILSGLTTSKVFPPSRMDARFWNVLLAQMSKLPADDTLCNLFVKVMAVMPAIHRPHVFEGVLSVLGCLFSAWSRSPPAPEGRDIRRLLDIDILGELYEKQEKLSALPANLRQARAISESLHSATAEETKELLSAAHRRAFSAVATPARGRHALRYSWLYMLAQMPHVNEDFLFDAAASLSGQSLNMPPLSIVEVSSLLLTQWASRGYLKSPKDVYRLYRRHRGKRDEAALAALFLAVFARGKGETKKGLYCSAWKLLSKLHQTDDVVRSLTFDVRTGKLPVRMLEDLACTAGDHHVAIRLRDLWSGQIMTKDQPQWFPGVFDKYAEDMVRDPTLPPKEIWRVLDIGKLESQGTLRNKTRHHRGTFGQRRADVVEKAARAFMAAPQLSNRAAVRHVSRSFAFLRAVRGQVPDFILQDMYRLVTKDLWEEKPGRTKRLLWFLRIVERKHGLELAWSCRLALRRWRARVTKIWISKGGGRRED